MGSYWMSEFPDIFQKLKDLLPEDCCRQQKFVVDTEHGKRCEKKAGEELLNHICKSHPDKAIHVVSEWLRLSMEACYRMGVSFGFYDMLELTEKVKASVDNVFKTLKEGDDPNESVQNAIMGDVTSILDAGKMNESGLHVAGMAISGARGKKQIRQLIGARGFLSPGALGYGLEEDIHNAFLFKEPLTKGMDWNTAFYAAMNARSSMCDKKLGTGHAGALTRKLVFALWPFKIVEDDCGSDESERSLVTCKSHDGFCAKCYGALANGELPSVGYPAGLIAAQSIGERGTQLSMQSFHTGTRAFDMSVVRKILSGKDEGADGQKIDYFDGMEKASEFVKRFKSESAYSDILDRHFELLWRILFDRTSSDKSFDACNHSLDAVIDDHDTITRLSYSRQAVNLLLAAMGTEKEAEKGTRLKMRKNASAVSCAYMQIRGKKSNPSAQAILQQQSL